MSELIYTPTLLRTPMVDARGLITYPWQAFFERLNTRVGGPIAETNLELAAESELELGGQTSSHLAFILAELDNLRSAIQVFSEQVAQHALAELAPAGQAIREAEDVSPLWAAFEPAADPAPVPQVDNDPDFALGGFPL